MKVQLLPVLCHMAKVRLYPRGCQPGQLLVGWVKHTAIVSSQLHLVEGLAFSLEIDWSPPDAIIIHCTLLAIRT